MYTQFIHNYTIVYKFTHNHNMLYTKIHPTQKCENGNYNSKS